ncbi:hypothetical protein C0992_006343 [Termitomyces sp. T32_za158]|nr:hypothetical protein C0992_006343 [Termitomyces sp. T32_za158]
MPVGVEKAMRIQQACYTRQGFARKEFEEWGQEETHVEYDVEFPSPASGLLEKMTAPERSFFVRQESRVRRKIVQLMHSEGLSSVHQCFKTGK